MTAAPLARARKFSCGAAFVEDVVAGASVVPEADGPVVALGVVVPDPELTSALLGSRVPHLL